uniref:C2H2-type domain-containing protein n=1 Tax=Plectus sambesii TaxID=2011161 RepID=A0A914WZU2_9BILA
MNSCPWPNCSETFDEHEEVKDHLSSLHLDYYPYRCGRCRVMFPSRIQVDYHWRAEHGDESPASMACCINRMKEKRLKELLSCQTAVDGSQHAITVTAEPTSNTLIDHNRFLRRWPRASQGNTVFAKENSAFDDSLAVGEFEIDEQSAKSVDFGGKMTAAAALSSALSAAPSPSSSSSTSPLMSSDGQLPVEIIERVRDMTANRTQLIDASIEHRARYFASQLAVFFPNVPLLEIQCSFSFAQKTTLTDLFEVQGWPARAVLNATLREYKALLPSNEAELLPIVRTWIAHARKIVSQHISRDREHSNETRMGFSTNKKPRLGSRLSIV